MEFWDYCDSIKVITIKTSDRINNLKKNLNKIGLENKYEYFYGELINNTDNLSDRKDIKINDILQNKICDKACISLAKNHLKIIKESYDLNHNNVLIMEDDARFNTPVNKKKIKKIFNWLKNNENKWDIFYFGYAPWPIILSRVESESIVELYHPLLSHAYIINRKGMEKILKVRYNDINYDNFLAKSNLKKYGAFPAICYQEFEPKASKYLNKFKYFSKIKNLTCYNTHYKILEYLSVIFPFIILIVFLIIIILIIIKILKNKNNN